MTFDPDENPSPSVESSTAIVPAIAAPATKKMGRPKGSKNKSKPPPGDGPQPPLGNSPAAVIPKRTGRSKGLKPKEKATAQESSGLPMSAYVKANGVDTKRFSEEAGDDGSLKRPRSASQDSTESDALEDVSLPGHNDDEQVTTAASHGQVAADPGTTPPPEAKKSKGKGKAAAVLKPLAKLVMGQQKTKRVAAVDPAKQRQNQTFLRREEEAKAKNKLSEATMHPRSDKQAPFSGMILKLTSAVLAQLQQACAEQRPLDMRLVLPDPAGDGRPMLKIEDQLHPINASAEDPNKVRVYYSSSEQSTNMHEIAAMHSKYIVEWAATTTDRQRVRERMKEGNEARHANKTSRIDLLAEAQQLAKNIPQKRRAPEEEDLPEVEATEGAIVTHEAPQQRPPKRHKQKKTKDMPHFAAGPMMVSVSNAYVSDDYLYHCNNLQKKLGDLTIVEERGVLFSWVWMGGKLLHNPADDDLYMKFESQLSVEGAAQRTGEPMAQKDVGMTYVDIQQTPREDADDVDRHGLWLPPSTSIQDVLDATSQYVPHQLMDRAERELALEGGWDMGEDVTSSEDVVAVQKQMKGLKVLQETLENMAFGMLALGDSQPKITVFEDPRLSNPEAQRLAVRVVQGQAAELQNKRGELGGKIITYRLANALVNGPDSHSW